MEIRFGKRKAKKKNSFRTCSMTKQTLDITSKQPACWRPILWTQGFPHHCMDKKYLLVLTTIPVITLDRLYTASVLNNLLLSQYNVISQIHPPIQPFIGPSIYAPTYPSTHPPIHQPSSLHPLNKQPLIRLFIHLLTMYLHIHPFMQPSNTNQYPMYLCTLIKLNMFDLK